MNRIYSIVSAVVCLCGVFACAAPPDPVALIQQAVKNGDHQVIIPPGQYRLAPGIVINGAHDLEIVGDGVTFTFTRLSRAIDFLRCTNVTFRGFTVDYDPLPFTQGKIIEAAPDESWVDVRLDAGYPNKVYSRVDICDPITRTRKRGMPFLWEITAKRMTDDVIRLSTKHLGAIAKVGDLVSMSTGPEQGGVPHGVTLSDCNSMTLQDVTVNTAPGMGILEADGEGNARYLHVRIVPGPKPDGATEARLLTTTWDAIQSKTVRKGPLLEKCEIRDAGDDSWSIQSSDFMVLATQGRDVVIGFRDEYCDGPQINDRLRLSIDGAEAKVVSRAETNQDKAGLSPDVIARLKGAKPWTLWKISPHTLKITLDRDCPFTVGQSVYCPDRQGNGFVIRGCTFHSPGRGALVKAGDGLIENNDFSDCHSAVTINAEIPGEAASGIQNIVIRNNYINGTGHFCPLYNSIQAGAVSIAGDEKSIRDITIDNNSFDDINGVNICTIGVQKLAILGNHFTRVHQTEPQITGGEHGIDQRSIIFVDRCADVQIQRNIADAMGPFTRTLLGMGKHFKLDPANDAPIQIEKAVATAENHAPSK